MCRYSSICSELITGLPSNDCGVEFCWTSHVTSHVTRSCALQWCHMHYSGHKDFMYIMRQYAVLCRNKHTEDIYI